MAKEPVSTGERVGTIGLCCWKKGMVGAKRFLFVTETKTKFTNL